MFNKELSDMKYKVNEKIDESVSVEGWSVEDGE